MPSSVSSSVASRPEWKGGSVTRDFCLPLFGTGSMLCADDGTATQGGVSYDTDAVHHDEVGSANVDTSEGNGYTCNVCLKSFSSSIQLWIHLPTHNRSNLRGRGQTFSKKAHAKMHLHSQESRISSRSKATVKHQCPKCLKTFCSPSKLRRHFLIHTGQKPYSCTTCWKSFRQKVHLKSHLGTANTCPHSAVNAGKRKRLSNDSRTSDLQPQRPSSSLTSSVELKLQCKISVNTVHDLRKTEIKLDAVGKPEQPLNTSSGCRKSGEQESQYLTQKDVKPFRCVICNRSFRLEVNLRRHHKIHWNKKELGKTWRENDYNDSSPREAALIASAEQQREPCRAASNQKRMNTSHRCHSCSKCFPSRSKLQRHVMTHTGQRPYNCETCGKRFRQKTHLRVHCRTHLWTRYQKQRSLYINRPPSQSGNKLLPHYSGRNEVLHLRKVSKANVRRAQAAKPMQNPGSEQHGCLQCSKCFPSASKLQRHEMVHTGLKPFQCPTCGKAFRQASHLKRHDRTHCNSEQPKPFNQQVTIKKLRLYPEITVCTPAQRRPISITKVPKRFVSLPCHISLNAQGECVPMLSKTISCRQYRSTTS
uniref:C2H2-type domain-containing protein n=1 Tax=Scophthalmus maximus TaxID=52904 RepID=A0A8D3B9H4_SCOMX